MKRFKQYQKTGVLAIDMVARCKDHFAARFRTVKEVYLRPDLWKQFTEYVKRQDEEIDTKEAIDFDDTLVKCGSLVGNNPMIYYLNPQADA